MAGKAGDNNGVGKAVLVFMYRSIGFAGNGQPKV